MTADEPIEQLITNVYEMDRDHCKAALSGFEQPSLDFTDDFLNQISLDRLRHILMAACLQSRRVG
ncbi:MAG: hypothetical protein QF785_13945 [Phycisphaeraceae bacterium]|jgi:hypothetical protein|nr:hypothetical protein [Phycisphaeraceae bacterium]MDP7348304.1 hypothetical protein [Phycisphaeraceae bacterium]